MSQSLQLLAVRQQGGARERRLGDQATRTHFSGKAVPFKTWSPAGDQVLQQVSPGVGVGGPMQSMMHTFWAPGLLCGGGA